MGLDGFAMGNLGLNADLTSAQMANQVEQLAKKESEFLIKDVTELSYGNGVKRKKGEQEGKNTFNGGFKQKKKDDIINSDEDEKKTLNEDSFIQKDLKDFFLRVNPKTNSIELFSNKDGRVLEEIPASDLMELVSRMNNPSGILVNKRI
jgi:uncharacterized FlaG/YvyC family protein